MTLPLAPPPLTYFLAQDPIHGTGEAEGRLQLQGIQSPLKGVQHEFQSAGTDVSHGNGQALGTAGRGDLFQGVTERL